MRLRIVLALLCGVLVGLGIAAGWRAAAPARPSMTTLMPPKGGEIREIVERVEHDYVKPVAEQQLLDSAVRGMVGSLDPYSAYLDKRQFEEMRTTTTGQYPGIGVEVTADTAGLKVVRAIQDTPASRAGVLAGDIIIRIADRAVGGDFETAIDRLRGPPGSSIKLTLLRAGRPEAFELTLERTEVAMQTVAHTLLEPGLGYLRISSFSDRTSEDARAALAELNLGPGGELRGLVLDLRNNPGGVLEAGVAVADLFLDEGVIVSANGRTPEARFQMVAKPGDVLRGAPLLVLVNGGSASAAEIVAGALKDLERATLIGRRTYGKGSVQTLIPLADGRALKLTTSLYFTPSGASIHERGIEPDITLAGEPQAPRDVTAAQDVPLAARDGEIMLALDRLRTMAGERIRPGRVASAARP